MPDRPLLLLDVDGTLCPIGPGPGGPMLRLVADELPVTYSAELPARLCRLGDVFDLVWATSWEHGANQFADALGLPPLPVIMFGGAAGHPGRTWKLPAVKRFVGERAVAWVDDELGQDVIAWAEKRAAPTLALPVDPREGLTDAHVDTLLAFARPRWLQGVDTPQDAVELFIQYGRMGDAIADEDAERYHRLAGRPDLPWMDGLDGLADEALLDELARRCEILGPQLP